MPFTPDTGLAFRDDVDLAAAKKTVFALHTALDAAPEREMVATLARHCATDAPWRIVHPFDAPGHAPALFWEEARRAFGTWQRRPDIRIAGQNLIDGFASVWVMEMGSLLGWWRAPFAGVAPSGRAAMLRFAQFPEIRDGRIGRSALFVDMLSLIHQSGRWFLPPASGAPAMMPGPRTHDGIVSATAPSEGRATLQLVSNMIGDLLGSGLRSARDHQAAFFAEDMCWWGPEGLGSSFSIDGYRHAHPRHFQRGIELIEHVGHEARIAEDAYCGFFGWPSIRVKATGGLMGLPGAGTAEMRITDIYRVADGRIAENWVFIDLLHFLRLQGLDVIERLAEVPA